MKKNLILGIFILLFFCAGAFALPGIDTVTGTIQNGQVITIKGTGFGTNGPNVVFFEDFENGIDNARIATAPAAIGAWTRGNLDYALYSATWAHSGAKSMKNNWDVPIGEPNNVDAAPKISFGNTDTVFYSFWTMVPAGMNIPGDNCTGGNPYGPNWKFSWMNFASNEYISAIVLNCNLTWGYWFGNGGEPRAGDIEGSFKMAKGRWSRFDFYQRSSSGNAGAIIGTEFDAVNGMIKRVDKNNVCTSTGGAVWNYLLIPGYGRGKTKNGVTVYDDIYIATGPGARARVEIGDAATYAACKNIAISTATSWSDIYITAVVRPGSFVDFSKAYLYVFDSAGNVNAQGFALNSAQPPVEPPVIPPESTGPLHSYSSGVTGQMLFDDNYIYGYTGARWKRAAWSAETW